jgi:iron complex transport system substrate-binding protein
MSNRLFIIISVFILSACTNHTDKKNDNTSGNKDVYKTSVKYAKGFTIEYHDGYKLVNVLAPWAKNKPVQYVLIHKGEKTPLGYKDAQIIQIPIKSIISLSSIYVAYLEKIAELQTLKGVDDYRYVNSFAVKDLIKKGQVAEMGNNTHANVEKFMAINPDLVFTYGMGNAEYDAMPPLRAAKLKVALAIDHLETSPLARAEWIKMMAVFFDKEKQADSVFNGIALRYESLADSVKKLATNKPSVMIDIKYGDTWFMPGGNSYISKLLADAGTNYLWGNDTTRGSLKLDFESVYNKAANADFWLNVHEWNTKQEVLSNDKRNALFKAFKNDNIFNNNARLNNVGGNDYWESGLLNADVVLADIVKIFHPELLPHHQMVYYKKIN